MSENPCKFLFLKPCRSPCGCVGVGRGGGVHESLACLGGVFTHSALVATRGQPVQNQVVQWGVGWSDLALFSIFETYAMMSIYFWYIFGSSIPKN